MNFIQCFIYLNQITNVIHSFKNDIHSSMNIFIHVGSMFKLHIHAQAIIYFFFVVTYIPRHMLLNFTHGIQGFILPNGFEAKSQMFVHNMTLFLVENKYNLDKIMQIKLKLFEMTLGAKLNFHNSMAL